MIPVFRIGGTSVLFVLLVVVVTLGTINLLAKAYPNSTYAAVVGALFH